MVPPLGAPSFGEPRTQNPEPRTRNPEPGTQNPEPRNQNPEPRTKNTPRTRNPEPRTQNPEPKTQNPEPRTQDRKPRTQNPGPRCAFLNLASGRCTFLNLARKHPWRELSTGESTDIPVDLYVPHLRTTCSKVTSFHSNLRGHVRTSWYKLNGRQQLQWM